MSRPSVCNPVMTLNCSHACTFFLVFQKSQCLLWWLWQCRAALGDCADDCGRFSCELRSSRSWAWCISLRRDSTSGIDVCLPVWAKYVAGAHYGGFSCELRSSRNEALCVSPRRDSKTGLVLVYVYDAEERVYEVCHVLSFSESELFLENLMEHIMADSRVTLAPRGVGRSAFHFAVTIRMRLTLVYVYDAPWVQCKDGFEKFGSVLSAVSGACAWRPCRDRSELV